MMLPKGFRAAGSTCGLKDSGRPDLAVFLSDAPCSGAGVFTTNRVVGAPVEVSRTRLPSDRIRAIVINSGNANACTGEQGRSDAEQMCADVAAAMGCEPEHVLVCSTGVIGIRLPMRKISNAIPSTVQSADTDAESFLAAATAMMTTDTFAKQASAGGDGPIRVAGAAKGAAMIAPNMATMLAVVMTDAALTSAQCDEILRHAVDRTFNCISVDGHMSTSDTVLLLSSGASGVIVSDLVPVQNDVTRVCEKLATDIIRDAEGGSHFITVDVEGFDSREAAFCVAKEVAESALVKTAITGNDPNWGRITSAAGYAGVEFDAGQLSLSINGITVYQNGSPVTYDEAGLSERMRNGDVELLLKLSGGPYSGSDSVRFWTSDLTQEYVRLNSEYTT